MRMIGYRYAWSNPFYRYAVALWVLLLSGCSPPWVDKSLVTYHVEFEADGRSYSATSTMTCYHVWSFALGDRWIGDFDDLIIRGSLVDGSKYLAVPSKWTCSGSAEHRKVSTAIYIQLLGSNGNLVESFDDRHDHSVHHQIRVRASLVSVESDGVALAETAKKTWFDYNERHSTSHWDKYYQTVGAKATPFADPGQAKKDFLTNECPAGATESARFNLGCADSVFHFHPIDAVSDESEAIDAWDGNAFNVILGRSTEAQTWVLNPNISYDGKTRSYKSPEGSYIAINFNGQRINVPSLLGREFYLDPASGKVVIFFEDDVILSFNHPVR